MTTLVLVEVPSWFCKFELMFVLPETVVLKDCETVGICTELLAWQGDYLATRCFY